MFNRPLFEDDIFARTVCYGHLTCNGGYGFFVAPGTSPVDYHCYLTVRAMIEEKIGALDFFLVRAEIIYWFQTLDVADSVLRSLYG